MFNKTIQTISKNLREIVQEILNDPRYINENKSITSHEITRRIKEESCIICSKSKQNITESYELKAILFQEHIIYVCRDCRKILRHRNHKDKNKGNYK